MMTYEEYALKECREWQRDMQRRPTLLGGLSRGVQQKLNSYIPERVHVAITAAIRQMVRGVLFGTRALSGAAPVDGPLSVVEAEVRRRIESHKQAAAAEGGVTGAGGFLASLADFPLLLGIKLKLLSEIAALYGYPARDYTERVYLLHVFELAFSSRPHRRTVFARMQGWKEQATLLPDKVDDFNWRSFQQEYRDHIDLAKLAQMVPGIGAVVGFVVNYRLLDRLGTTAMNAYRMRWQEEGRLGSQM
ncbi:EcsC family protein [Flaviaesturariibacter amylovorans]|uniref:EcsC family protein n=1 Tax=Flaviaesturariibacter amylovorans TaxID=1084520 RepID=A0ABP8GHH5_9BACT